LVRRHRRAPTGEISHIIDQGIAAELDAVAANLAKNTLPMLQTRKNQAIRDAAIIPARFPTDDGRS
jgi:hypothetical protein